MRGLWWLVGGILAVFAAPTHAVPANFSQPSLPPQSSGVTCGALDTQVTLCFPGLSTAARCEYAVTNKSSGSATAQACPSAPLFGEDCTALPGLLLIAFGPCSNDIVLQTAAIKFAGSPALAPAPGGADLRSIPDWLEALGLQDIQQVGGLLIRGYAYQTGPLPSTAGVDLLPGLEKVGTVVPVTLDNARLSPLTILGASVPQLDFVTDLEGGMLIENTPNTNFSKIFGSLDIIKGIIRIVGNPQLTSLDGLQGLALFDSLSNLEILSNSQLTDIDALGSVFLCEADGSTGVQPPFALVGVVEVKPANPKTALSRCLLTTAEQVCTFIATTACPSGTDSIASGTVQDPLQSGQPPVSG